jgi:phage shock protein E
MSRKHKKPKQVFSKPGSHQQQRFTRRSLSWLWLGLGALIVVVVGVYLLNSGTGPSSVISSTQTVLSVEISPAQAYAKLQQGAFFLDVRNQDEWDQFHITGSILIPLDQLQNRLNELPREKEIVVVCLSGHRSKSGTAILQQAGLTHVYCLSGGLQAWRAAGYSVQGNPP